MIVSSQFRPAWWCRNRHAQTVYQNLLRPRPRPATRRERLELPDGDFIDLDWVGPDSGPLVLLLHGLEGSIRSKYAAGQLAALKQAGLRGVLMHFRGCSEEPNRLRRGYHSGETGDLDQVVRVLDAREPDTPKAAVGYSLGGNVLLKWLGESGPRCSLRTGVAVSVPFQLAKCSHAVDQGLSRFYREFLMRRMRASYRRKFLYREDAPYPVDHVDRLIRFRDFDDAITAPIHGFADWKDYYDRSSSLQYLSGVRVPTLILHARDDPFMTPDTPPREGDLSESVRVEISPRGGHVGFVSGRWPWRPRWWLEERILRHLQRHLAAGSGGQEN